MSRDEINTIVATGLMELLPYLDLDGKRKTGDVLESITNNLHEEQGHKNG